MNSLPFVRFVLPLTCQIALIASIPAQAIYTHLTGTEVVLQTVPVDPYDLLRGYSQTLRYNISQVEKLETLNGWESVVRQTRDDEDETLPPDGTSLYVILQAPETESESSHPTPWEAIAVRYQRPVELGNEQIAIKGELDNRWVNYGLERYYFPEQQREELNQRIRNLQADETGERPFVVEAKVDERGNAVPVSLWLEDFPLRF
ncbi:GDYXXLXY domain-containing protein [Euhalothece natronophila Z-M001]|uniref:GDYXXLXY domain-containing protein n=1 Tax=Euhalothece natronophila Z-M001 TaxID=522448 RepID=A0A5B8NKQ2_9CHRO|nr:GDYXXLXY domain-containing protein [Euhalothece natronophila]QDZ39538.1 GDYXXLXY domain-containing protein [Euhalothece natronophila Z-M001]